MIYSRNTIATAVCLAIVMSQLASARQIRSTNSFELEKRDQETEIIDESRELSRHGSQEYSEDGGEDYGAKVKTRNGCQGYTCDFRSSCGLAPLNRIGRARSAVTPYIVNGEDQIYGEWPSFARLIITYKGGYRSWCGATIVSDRHILTAAHCIYHKENRPARIDVVLGDHDKRYADHHERVYQSHSRCVPRDFINGNVTSRYSFDWAVLTLKNRITFTDHIQPACLPYDFNGRPRYQHCHLVGQGTTAMLPNGSGIEQPVTQKMRVQQVSCAIKDFIGGFTGATVACYTKAGSNGSACFGDSGGPILCLDATTNRWTVIATTSAGRCGQSWLSKHVRTTTSLPNIKAQCMI